MGVPAHFLQIFGNYMLVRKFGNYILVKKIWKLYAGKKIWKPSAGNPLMETFCWMPAVFEGGILVKGYGIVLRFKAVGPGTPVKHPGIANLSRMVT